MRTAGKPDPPPSAGGIPLQIVPVAIGDYDHHPALAVEPEVSKLATLLTDFGAEVVPWLAAMADRGADAVNARLRAWSRSPEQANSILYWVGHGWNRGRRAALAHARSPAAVAAGGVSPEAFAEALLDRQAQAIGNWTVVVIDACWSSRFVDRVNAALSDDEEAVGDVLLVGTSGSGATTLGHFTSVLASCLNEDFAAVNTIPLWDLGRELQDRLPDALVIPRRVGDGALVRRASPVAATLPGPLDVVRDLERVVARLTPDARRHFLIKAQGAEEGEISWFFEGRVPEHTMVVDWLWSERGGLVVVTGEAGSGKSALLGHLLLHSLPDLRGALAEGGLVPALPASALPPNNAFDEVVHLTGIDLSELVTRVADAVGLGPKPSRSSGRSGMAHDIDWLITELTARASGLTLLLDALDEAIDPLGIAHALLGRLARVPGVRLLVGTRVSTRDSPDHSRGHDHNILDALGAGSPNGPQLVVQVRRDSEAVVRYVRQRLWTARNRGKLSWDGEPVPDQAIERAARLVAECKHEFLFARLAVYELLAEPSLLHPARSVSLHRLLSGDHRDIFAAAVSRLSRRSDGFQPLLEALALARGRGAPILDGVWARMANSMVDAGSYAAPPITPADISALLAIAQPYVAVDAYAGQTVYRLAHRTFVEQFEDDWRDTRRDDAGTLRDRHRRVALALAQATRNTPGESINPYIQRHLSGHVADADDWAVLVDNLGVLDRLDPDAVLADAQRTVIGRGRVLPPIAGVVGARHRLSNAPVADRPGLRQLATYRHSGQRRGQDSTSGQSPWGVAAAEVSHFPLHIILEGHTGYVRSLCTIRGPDAGAEGHLLVSAGDDGSIRLWNPTTGTPVGAPMIGHAGRVETVCRVGDAPGALIASGGTDGTVRFWEPVTGTAVGLPRTGHFGAIEGICALHWNGRLLVASAGADGTVRVWDADDPAGSAAVLRGHDGPARAVCPITLPGGRSLLASAGVDGTIRLWDTDTWTPADAPIRGHLGGVTSVCTVNTQDGTLLASAGVDGTVHLWDPVSGRSAGPPMSARSGGVAGLCAVESATEGSYLAAAIVNGTVQFWDPYQCRRVGPPLSGHTGPVRGVCSLPMPGGRTLLSSAGADGTVRIWDAATAVTVTRRLSGYTRPARGVCAVQMRDGRQALASSEADGTIRLWSARTATPAGPPLHGHSGPVWGVCQVHDRRGGALLVSCGADAVIRLWDPETGREQGPGLRGHVGTVAGICAVPVSGAADLLASSGGDGSVRLWDPWRHQQIGPAMTGHTGTVWKVCTVASADGSSLIASAGSDGAVRRWDSRTQTPVGEPMLGHAGTVRGGVCGIRLPSGRRVLVSAGNDGTIRLWDPDTGEQDGPAITEHTGTVVGVCSLPWPDGREILASAGVDGTIRLWDLTTRRQVGSVLHGSAGGHWGICAVIQQDRVLLGLSGNDGSVRLWDPVRGRPFGPPLSGSADAVHSVGVAQLGRGRLRCALTGNDDRIRLWDPVTAKSLERHTGHRGPVTAVAVLPDSKAFASAARGPVIVTGGADGSIRLIGVAADQPLGRPLELGAAAPVLAICVLPQREGLVAVSHDSAVKICDLARGEVIDIVRDGVPDHPRALLGLDDGTDLLVCSGQDGRLRAWSPLGQPTDQPAWQGHDDWTWALCAVRAPVPGRVASAGADTLIRVWDVQRRQAIGEPLLGHRAPIHALAEVAPTSGEPLLVSGGEDDEIRLWDLRSRSLVHTIPFGVDVWALAYLPGTPRFTHRTNFGAAVVVGAADGVYLLMLDGSLFRSG